MASTSGKALSHSLQSMRAVLHKLMRWAAPRTSIQAIHGDSSEIEHGCSAGSAVVILVMLMKMRIPPCAMGQMTWTWAPRAAAHPLGRNMLLRSMHCSPHQMTLELSSPRDDNLNSELRPCVPFQVHYTANRVKGEPTDEKCSILSRPFYIGICYVCSISIIFPHLLYYRVVLYFPCAAV